MSDKVAPLHGITGVVHLPPMPGDPAYIQGGFDGVFEHAMRDADALAQGGVGAIIVENFGSAPFPKGTSEQRIPAHQTAFMARVARAMVEKYGLPIGINCLRNDVLSALGIAAAVGASFVRVNVHTGAYVTDQGLIEGDAYHSLRYRSSLGAEKVSILADVLVKHAAPLAPVSPTDATKECLQRGRANAVIVTGTGTGEPVSVPLLKEVSEAASQAGSVLIGSGFTPERAKELCPYTDGAIVGSWLKKDGILSNPIDETQVRELVSATQGLWRVQP